jgi:hypothetical protein
MFFFIKQYFVLLFNCLKYFKCTYIHNIRHISMQDNDIFRNDKDDCICKARYISPETICLCANNTIHTSASESHLHKALNICSKRDSMGMCLIDTNLMFTSNSKMFHILLLCSIYFKDLKLI